MRRYSSKTKIETAGYVIINEGAIWGVGKTESEAWEDSLEWIESDDDTGPVKLALDCDGRAIGLENSNALGFTAEPASAALIKYLRDGGTPNTWGMVGGVQCTSDEENAVPVEDAGTAW